jgi:hypothetical protein
MFPLLRLFCCDALARAGSCALAGTNARVHAQLVGLHATSKVARNVQRATLKVQQRICNVQR